MSIDPSFNAYFTDENGIMLSIAEVRECAIAGQPLVLNEDANRNSTPYTKERYLDDYMAKNLYWFQACDKYGFNNESPYRSTGRKWLGLAPEGMEPVFRHTRYTSDPEYFWQNP
ncbi:MAG: hypothetical protein LIO79_10430 [Rikenellaceae bacterium]|nr:hypothetical protein [Rikenellaceae bacterium]